MYQEVMNTLFELHLSDEAWSSSAITICGEQVNDLQDAIVNQQDIGAMIKRWVKTGGDRELALSLVQRSRLQPDLKPPTFGVSLLALASERPGHCWVIDGMLSAIQKAEGDWAKGLLCCGVSSGHAAQRQGINARLSFDLAKIDADQASAILTRLQGDFGHEIDSILDAAIKRQSTSWGCGVDHLVSVKALMQSLISALCIRGSDWQGLTQGPLRGWSCR
jgi:hypothetical protein